MGFRLSAGQFRSILIVVSQVLAKRASARTSFRSTRRGRRVAVLVVLILVISMSACEAQNTLMQKADTILTCEITGKGSYSSGEPAIFEFRLENRSSQAIFVLKWHTPLEGIISRIFKVTRDGEELDYLGPMVRRGDPIAEDYEEIEPGKSASASFDLAEVYDVTSAGEYRLKFVSRLLDVTTNPTDVPRPLDRHQPLDIECNDIAFVIQKQPDVSPP